VVVARPAEGEARRPGAVRCDADRAAVAQRRDEKVAPIGVDHRASAARDGDRRDGRVGSLLCDCVRGHRRSLRVERKPPTGLPVGGVLQHS